MNELLAEATQAVRSSEWIVVQQRAEAVLALDPGNANAQALIAAAERAQGAEVAPPNQGIEPNPASPLYLLTSSPAPLAAVKAFFGAVEQPDYETAYALFLSDLRQRLSYKEFTTVARTHVSAFDAAYRQWSTDMEASSATVEGQLTTREGSETTIFFRLVAKKGDWQIVGYLIQDESGSVEAGVPP